MNNQELRNFLQRLINERKSRRAGGAGPPSNLNVFNNNQLNQAIANLNEALAEIGTHIGRTDKRLRHNKRPYKRPRTRRERIEPRLAQTRKLIKEMEENKRWGSQIGLAARRIYERKLRRMAAKKWPVRKSRFFLHESNNSSNANNLRVTGREGATHRGVRQAIIRGQSIEARNLSRKLEARPLSPKTAIARMRENMRNQYRRTGFGQESGTEAAQPRQKRSYSSGSSSRNSKTPSPNSSMGSKSASAGSAASNARKNNNQNK